MSLLMDALKKAEQEKKEAAKRLEQASEATRADRTGEHPADVTAEHEVRAAPAAAPTEKSGLSLELMSPDSLSPDPQPAVHSLHDTSPPLRSRELELAAFNMEMAAPAAAPTEQSGERTVVEDARPAAGLDMDQTFHGIQLPDAAAPGPAIYEETVQGEQFEAGPVKSNEETLPGVPAIQFAREIGGKDQPTPVAAQTVFSAGETGRQSSSSRWNFVYISLILVIAVAGFLFVYFNKTPAVRQLPSPWVARGIETNVPSPAAFELPTEPPVSGTLVSGMAPAGESPAAAAEPVVTATEVAISTSAPEAAPPAETAPAVANAAGPDTAKSAPAEVVPVEQPVVAEALPATFASPPSLIRISRGTKPSDEGLLLKQAYSDYNSGNLEAAKGAYMEVLTRLPDNTDALLGLGAIAMKEGDLGRAVEIYARVLGQDPRNKTALAALIGMQKDGDLGASESALKTLLQENPDSPHLYFTLGTVYAAQQRWAEAQQAFFDAYRNDSVNPDYALNLAVCLDRLGQHETALDYYNVALRLSDDRHAGFDPGVVLARIQVLSAAQGQP